MKGRASTGGRHLASTMSRTHLRCSGKRKLLQTQRRAREGWSLSRQPHADRRTGYELTKSLSRESPDRQFRQQSGKVEVPLRPSTNGRQTTRVAAVICES
jgi:hypothetical protein